MERPKITHIALLSKDLILSLEQITNKQKIEGHKQPEFITKQQKLNHVEQQYACVYVHIYRQLTARTLLHQNTSQYNKT